MKLNVPKVSSESHLMIFWVITILFLVNSHPVSVLNIRSKQLLVFLSFLIVFAFNLTVYVRIVHKRYYRKYYLATTLSLVCRCFHIIHKGDAINREEYVPLISPIINGKANSLMDCILFAAANI